MRSPYQRRQPLRIRWWQFILLLIGIVLIVVGWNNLRTRNLLPDVLPVLAPAVTPTVPDRLTSSDVLPTPTIDPTAAQRGITFPGALVTSRIILAARTTQSWETRYLGDSVGHLQGTSWIGEPGGNTVLAGHVTNPLGEDGPFAYLFEAQIGDQVIITEGDARYRYRVSRIERVPPDAIQFVAQDGIPRLTLITCDDWNYAEQTYDSRLIVIAEPENLP